MHAGTKRPRSPRSPSAAQPPNEDACYIFLDIDGVLNCAPSRAAAQRLHGEAQQTLALAGAPRLIRALKHLVEQTNAQIILSSTWRVEESTRAAVRDRLRSFGLVLLAFTPELSEEEAGDKHFALCCSGPDGEFLPELERAIEIQRWLLQAHGGEVEGCRYVALDDMDLTGASGRAAGVDGLLDPLHFVRTDDMRGLTRLRAEVAVAKLRRQEQLHRERTAPLPEGSAPPSDGADDAILCASSRFDFRSPAASRDELVHALFNDRATMLPWLPMLCPISAADMTKRRASQRDGKALRVSCFMDIVDQQSGELVGTAGFRSIEGRRAEFGIVVKQSWQRCGVCRESFLANAAYAWDVLGCSTIVASTLESNSRMRAFCSKAGMALSARKEDHGLEWWVHEANIEDGLDWEALSAGC